MTFYRFEIYNTAGSRAFLTETASYVTYKKLGISFFAEYEQINKETRSRADINLNRLRDQMRSRSEPCLSYSQSHRRSKEHDSNSLGYNS